MGFRNRILGLWVVLLLVLTCGCMKRQLATGLTEAEAREIIVLLHDHGISADLQEVAREREAPSYTVSVMGGGPAMVQAWRVMQENGLPRAKSNGLQDVYANPGLIPTAAQEKAKLLVGLSGEISRMLNSVVGVVDARVQVVIPDDNPLVDRSQWHPPSASVLFKYQGAKPPLTEAEIKSLVAKGVEGLAPENIAVVFNKVQPKAPPDHDIFWLIQNQQFILALVIVLVLETLCLMIFLGKSRSQAKQIARLTGMLGTETRQLAETAVRR
jgi:type III secretion protein J